MGAMKKRMYYCVRRLIDDGANINVRDLLGNIPLSVAISNSLKNIVMQLISSGSNVNTKNCFGNTPLMLAI